MSKRGWYATGCLVLLGAVCSVCLWSFQESPRFSYTYDIGGGRTLRVWSIRDVTIRDLGRPRRHTDPQA